MYRRTTIATLLLALLACGACKEAPQIAAHRVPKTQSGIEDFRRVAAAVDAPASARKPFPTPDGWTRGKANPMFPSDKFLKSFDGEEVVFSIMPLPSSNTWTGNVQRWLGQVSMQLAVEEIEEQTIDLEVDGIPSKKIRLFQDNEDSKAVVGIMTVKGKDAWFSKLMGKRDAVEAAEKEFDAYVKTLQLP